MVPRTHLPAAQARRSVPAILFVGRAFCALQSRFWIKRTNKQAVSAATRLMDSKPATAPLTVSAEQRWWTDKSTAIVTGGNKGIGWEICRKLSEQGLRTILTARDVQRGQEAVTRLSKATGKSNVEFAQLDIDDPESIQTFVQWAKEELKSVDILFNNAAIAFKGNAFGADEARTTMATNYHGTKAICEALLPLMHEGGRIVNVSSGAGKQSHALRSDALRQRFQDAKSAQDVTLLAEQWLAAVSNNSHVEEGYSSSMYGMSKLCQATYTRVLAAELEPRGISANVCCPGLTATDFSSWHQDAKPASEGADTPVYTALLLPQRVTGQFIKDREAGPF